MLAEHPSKYNHTLSALLVVLPMYIFVCLYRRLCAAYRIRSRYHDVPSLPRHPVWGNIVNAGKPLDPSLSRHPDYGF